MKLWASLSVRQRITIAIVAALAGAAIYGLVYWQHESDFRPLFTGLAPEDAGGIVQKLKEAGVDFRLSEAGTSVLVPSGRVAELRLSLAAAGLPKSGRIGFELFDKTNLGATEFTEQVNFRRALEGELERSVMSLAEVEQARVHLTFPKESVFLDSKQPAKASVLVRLRPGAHLAPPNVLAVSHLVASAVEGLSPDAVTVLDMNGNLLARARAPGSLDGPAPSEAGLDYRHSVEADLLVKINSTLDPLLGPEKFRAGVSVECDFSGGEQSEEIYDPTRSAVLSSQKTEDNTGANNANGVPGTASTLPRPTSRPGGGATQASRLTENITYQPSRTIKKMRLPAGGIRKISVAVLLDQKVNWEKDKSGFRRVLVPPTAEKIKVIHDLVAGVTGFNPQRGDQLIVETQPFEITLMLEPPGAPGPASRNGPPTQPQLLTKRNLMLVGGAAGGLIVIGIVLALLLRRGQGRPAVSAPAELPAPPKPSASAVQQQFEAQLAEHEALEREAEVKALSALKLVPVITKTAEVMAKHIRENIKEKPDISAQALKTWIKET